MLAEDLAAALRGFTRRTPFRPFTIELVMGERIRVEYPEALVFRDSVAVYFSPQREITIFDHEGVVRLTDQQEDSPVTT